MSDDSKYGVQPDGTFWPNLMADLCEWLIENVTGPNLDSSNPDDDEMTAALREALRHWRLVTNHLARMEAWYAVPAYLEETRVLRARVDPILGTVGQEPMEELAGLRGELSAWCSTVLILSDRWRAYDGLGSFYRPPGMLKAAMPQCRMTTVPCGFRSCELHYGEDAAGD